MLIILPIFSFIKSSIMLINRAIILELINILKTAQSNIGILDTKRNMISIINKEIKNDI